MVRRLTTRGEPTDRFGLLLALLVATFLVSSLDDRASVGTVAAVLNAAVLVVAVRSTGLAATSGRLAMLLVIALLTALSAVVFDAGKVGPGLAWSLQALVLAIVAVATMQRLLEHERVHGQTILAAVSVYVLVGLCFGSIYGAFGAVLDEPVLSVNAGGSADTMYYSFVTLTTVGFGDLTSTIDLVRHVSVIEAMFGQVFLVTLVARMVSLYGTGRNAP